MERLSATQARRLALARAGLLPAEWSGIPRRAAGEGARARAAAHAVIGRFGYLQLDTVCVAGARSHALVLLARLEGMDPALGESLLLPGEPLFEYWGHAASWMPLDLYPVFGFRRRAYKRHPWWGEVIDRNRAAADALLRRTRDEGPFRAADLEGKGTGGWWSYKASKRVAEALWSAGALAVRERRDFRRTYDLAERVIPAAIRERELDEVSSYRALILKSLDGHGWAEAGTIAATFFLRKTRPPFRAAMASLEEEGEVVPCEAEGVDGVVRRGWVRPGDLDFAARLGRLRPREDRGVLLTPFDPILWDRERVMRLFGFRQVLEIYVPARRRKFGYFCMPVLAGERLVARVDVKADRAAGRLRTPALHWERPGPRGRPSAADRAAVEAAIARHARALGLATA
jgi:uncharacterized protein YcaQ